MELVLESGWPAHCHMLRRPDSKDLGHYKLELVRKNNHNHSSEMCASYTEYLYVKNVLVEILWWFSYPGLLLHTK